MIRKGAFGIAPRLVKAAVINTYQPVWKLLQRRGCLCTSSLSKGRQKVVTCTPRPISATACFEMQPIHCESICFG